MSFQFQKDFGWHSLSDDLVSNLIKHSFQFNLDGDYLSSKALNLPLLPKSFSLGRINFSRWFPLIKSRRKSLVRNKMYPLYSTILLTVVGNIVSKGSSCGVSKSLEMISVGLTWKEMRSPVYC